MTADEFVVDFPTLWVACDWIEEHCRVPDGFRKGEPFRMYDWQLWCTANFYRLKPAAVMGQLAPAFRYRRSQCVAPQKTGKGPWTAAICANEAVGPAVFNGWAQGGEVYDCRRYGCGCGWMYEYEPGEPMAIPWPTPLVQITAFSEEQTDNVYRPLQAMIRSGPLGELMKVGEQFIRLPNDGRIDVVTSSAQSRLGNPVTFVLQDETQLWTIGNKMNRVAETQRRGAAGMGGRTMETTNAWDPSEGSVAERTATAAGKVADIFRFHRLPPHSLKYTVKADRRKIHRYVYSGSTHVDLDAIEAEALELLTVDPGQAERFYGNRIVAGADSFIEPHGWAARLALEEVPDGARITLGFDGSDVDDWTAIRAETLDGYQFTPTYGPDRRPTVWNPAEWDGQAPRLEVDAAVEELMARYDVVRMYCDPPYWDSEVDGWSAMYGDRVVVDWYTNRVRQMHEACQRLITDVTKRDSTWRHDGCELTAQHVANARKAARPAGRYVLRKASPAQKIDLAVCSVLAHEAAMDATAAGLTKKRRRRVAGF
ncbi:hypothetical protein [Streptomyces sp. CBG31]|uniref:hypothetical protein n=1 Tax=Streptomyces sp. CBG31 TaxID=2762623 RepID=UPI001EFC5374|nr:hypothetical protein [Streptomyces sp. CBG31]